MKPSHLLPLTFLCSVACQAGPPRLEHRVGDPWKAAIASISDPDQCPQYAGLRIDEQPHLVPIGRDPASGNWEFGYSRSGSLPTRNAQGSLAVGKETGLVFVLIPGGSFLMGAQASEPSAPGYDAGASEWEAPVRSVTIEPFFLSKFEMTAAQWQSLRGGDLPADGADLPAFQISWTEGSDVLSEAGLVLPTSAQWEYAARGATMSPWWTGDALERLDGAENLLDESGIGIRRNNQGQLLENFAPWNDGHPGHASVGSFRPNPFGLYDVHGNAFEWCRDTPDAGRRTVRGGGSYVLPKFARVSIEWDREPEFRSGHVGVRPAIEIRARTQR